MENLNYIWLFVPVIVINLILVIVSLRDLLKNRRVRYGSIVIWILIILFIQIIGPILYLTIGRDD